MSHRPWVSPPPLRRGDVVRVVAPSSPAPPTLVWRGLGWLATHFRLRFDRGVFARSGYHAGDDARRLDAFASALVEPGVSAVWCVRGGVGATRFAAKLRLETCRDAPRWVIGFSDVTALHTELTTERIMSVHGPHVTAVGRSDAQTRAAMLDLLERPHRPRRHLHLETLVAGEARGRLVGGNLALVHDAAAARRLRWPPGVVLFLEDVGERPYRIDRMLTSLRVGGHLDSVSGVALGDFTNCAPGPDGTTAHDVAREHFEPLGVPVVAGVPAGHGRDNQPLILGAPSALFAPRGTGRRASLELFPSVARALPRPRSRRF
ncbi:MAG: LD-carboxypeptidase [Myxococcota bacterium]